MTESNKLRVDPNAWKSWYAARGIVPDEDMPMLADTFQKHSISRVLDAGCGLGRHTVFLAEKGFDVYAFDFKSDSVEATGEKLKEKNFHANLKVWDIADHPLPYKDGFFGAIISTLVLEHFLTATIQKIANEIDRITHKSGYVYLHVLSLERMLQRQKESGRPPGEKVEEGTFLREEGDQKGIPHHFFTAGELGKFFRGYNVISETSPQHFLRFLAVKK